MKPGNQQTPVRPWLNKQGRLRIHSVFSTIQGEGPWVGVKAAFVRLYGCNLQCPRCDTDYTSTLTEYGADELVAKVIEIEPAPSLIVITGGEPMLQNLVPFLQHCQAQLPEVRVQIETNGTVFPDVLERGFCHLEKVPDIVCSPKINRVNARLFPYITAFKYIISEGDVGKDGLPKTSLGHPAKPRVFRPKPMELRQMELKGMVFVQPECSKFAKRSKANLQAAIASVREQGWRLSLQTHKIIGLP